MSASLSPIYVMPARKSVAYYTQTQIETMKITEPLNPNAEEWRPTSSQPSPLLPVAIIPTPLPPPFLPPLKLFIPRWMPIYSISFPVITFPAPTNPLLLGAADAGEKEVITHKHEVGESSRRKKALPPRLKRAAPPRQAAAPNVPEAAQPKLVWKQRDPCTKVPGAASRRPPPSPPTKTTLMIKNIPSQLRRDFMLKFLDGYCRTYSLEYDFFYLPMDFCRLGNLGYCFVNLTTTAAAYKLKKVLTNFKWRTIFTRDGDAILTKKICEVSWARVQGKDKLVRRFEGSSFKCNELEFLPVVFDPPRNGSDQNPPPPVTLGRISQPR